LETPKQQYERREGRFIKQLQKQQKTERSISNLRLAVFTLGIGATITLYILHNYILSALVFFVTAALFIYLVIRHSRLTDKIKYTTLLRDINSNSLKRLKGEWNTFADDGGEFQDDEHNYSKDLDIFGKDSLFQWINTAKTYVGRCKLRELFLGAVGNREDVLERQEAVVELAAMLSWRQRFLAEAMFVSGVFRNPQDILSWAKESNELFRKPWLIAAISICPVITVLLAVTGFVLNLISWSVPIIALVIQFALLSYKAKARNRMFSISESYAGDLRVYYKMLKLFEEQDFESPQIKKIAEGIRTKEGSSATRQIGKLSSLVDSIANRRNAFYLIFNIVTLWDFHHIVALERWKQKSGPFLQDWFDALAKVEALTSLANIRFDNPDWAMPKLHTDNQTFIKAKGLGHPLLSGRVHNDLAIDSTKKVLLITGSNMSGKSTLLRTAGINLVLAYAGAPVCAKSFETSMLEIYTSMRVSDNLKENISSFYAELLRIKEIVRNAEAGKKVFFLLDEVFKGTNSLDRHTGAKVLINKLSTTKSIGLVSTHDLELCDLDKENPGIDNYHFQEHYRDGKICFDYRLRPGPSVTRNALYLMRLVGIEVE